MLSHRGGTLVEYVDMELGQAPSFAPLVTDKIIIGTRDSVLCRRTQTTYAQLVQDRMLQDKIKEFTISS